MWELPSDSPRGWHGGSKGDAGAHTPDMPVISLDQLRNVMGDSPTEAQGRVVQTAQVQARIHLWARQPFLWNAINLTQATRQKLISLCEGYGATVRIIYLETEWEENLRRNAERKGCVPEPVIAALPAKMTPRHGEARQIGWQYLSGESPPNDSAAYPMHVRYAAFTYPLACRMPVLTILK